MYLFRVSRGSFLVIIPVSGSTVVKTHLVMRKMNTTLTANIYINQTLLIKICAKHQLCYRPHDITRCSLTLPIWTSSHESWKR